MKYIYGLNITGQSIIKYFLTKKILFYAWDDNPIIRKKIKNKFKEIDIIDPQLTQWSKISEIFLSSGISIDIKSLRTSKKYNIPIYRDLELYSKITKKNKIIAITGTNGKSTTTKLIANQLSSNKIDCFYGGNLHPPLIDFYNKKNKAKYHVIELSSYQLESCPSFAPFISILLNISNDHQDRYKSYYNYAQTKEKIFNLSKTKFGIISIDDPYSRSIYNRKKNRITLIPFSINRKIPNGVSLIKNKIYDNFFTKKIYNLDQINHSLSGFFNSQNIVVTYIVSKILKISHKVFLVSIKKFKGLPHRLELVYKNKDYKIINNSKATNIVSAINSIKVFDNIYLIIGGKIKNKNFSVYKKVKNKIIKCFIIGESTEFIFDKIKNNFQSYKCFTLNNAIEKIFKELKNNNAKITILLSPACSSFDQFKNFEDRGNQFKKIILKKVFKR